MISLNANSQIITAMDSRVTSFTGGIATNSNNIDALNNIVTTNMIGIDTLSSDIETIDNRVSSFANGIATNSDNINTLNNIVTS